MLHSQEQHSNSLALIPFLAIVAALSLLLGCGHAFEMTAPAGFVELEERYSGYDYRAVTADGLVIGVREIEHDPQGEIGFWTRAIENRMRERGGYALLDNQEVRTASGLKGQQLRFGHDEDGQHPHLYVITVFVTDDHIFLVEAGGTKELMTKHADQVNAAVQGFRAD